MAASDATQIQEMIADAEVAAATVETIGSITVAQCRVEGCPVVCKVFHMLGPEGYYPTGIASEEGETDLTNCTRPTS